jgi:hypothetical protein
MRHALLIAALLLASLAAARAQVWIMSPASQMSGKAIPPLPQPTGDILLVDGTSLLLQTDNASLICRAGGC